METRSHMKKQRHERNHFRTKWISRLRTFPSKLRTNCELIPRNQRLSPTRFQLIIGLILSQDGKRSKNPPGPVLEPCMGRHKGTVLQGRGEPAHDAGLVVVCTVQ